MATGLVNKAYREIDEQWTGATNIGTSATTAGVAWMNSSDAGNTAFAITDTADGPIARGATDATDDDMCEISHRALAWSVQNGDLLMRTRVRVSSGTIASIALTVGFNDDQLEDSNTLPVELATTTFTSNASTFIGVVYDADATNQDFHAFWVDDDADTTQAIGNLRFTGIAPVANKWFGVEVLLSDAGSGNGVEAVITVSEESTGAQAEKRFHATVDRDALLVPHIAFENRAGSAHQVDIDNIYVRMSRPTT